MAASCQGAPRTCRCIETLRGDGRHDRVPLVREHHAPVGALRPIYRGEPATATDRQGAVGALRHERRHGGGGNDVRGHHAPVGALRLAAELAGDHAGIGQGAPRTCRCIETYLTMSSSSSLSSSQGAPRTCRCIEAGLGGGMGVLTAHVRECHASVGVLSLPCFVFATDRATPT